MAKRIDLKGAASTRHLKALVYGKSGTGKTTFGVSAPRPLILLSEGQAVPNIRAAAKRHGTEAEVLFMESLDDYRNVIRALNGDPAKPFVVVDSIHGELLRMDPWPESVVIDSLTDACELVSKEIREQSPPRAGKDGLPVDSERYWNVFSDRAQKLIRAFRDAPLNVLFLCLLDDRELGKDDAKVRWVGPQLAMRKLPAAVMAAVNVVGVTYRKRATKPDPVTKELPMIYGIQTTGATFMELKPFPPLRDNEVTDFKSWCQRVNGIDDGSIAPEPEEATALADIIQEKPAA